MQRSVCVIGMGNWGSSLVHALSVAGVPIPEVIVQAGSRRGTARWRRSLPFTPLNRARLDADVLWLCVPDAAIAEVARQVANRAAARGGSNGNVRGQLRDRRPVQIIVHSSGALSAQVLQPFANMRASVSSVHPVMSFPTRHPVSLQGVWFGIEAEAAARRVLNSIVRRMGGRPFSIEGRNKALYHAVGMLSSPLLVSHLAAAQQVAALAGFSPRQARRLIEPITRATLDNVFASGAGKSFSGPIARGDVETIRLHLQALKPHPMLASVYRSLALYALTALPALDKKKVHRLLR